MDMRDTKDGVMISVPAKDFRRILKHRANMLRMISDLIDTVHRVNTVAIAVALIIGIVSSIWFPGIMVIVWFGWGFAVGLIVVAILIAHSLKRIGGDDDQSEDFEVHRM